MNATRLKRAPRAPAPPVAALPGDARPHPNGFFAVWFIVGRTAAGLRRALDVAPVLARGMVLAAALATAPVQAAERVQVATDAAGRIVRLEGTVVIVEPDIELSVITAGGLEEPRQEWSNLARTLYPAQARARLKELQVEVKPDLDIADDLDPASALGQILRLNQAVAVSITQYSIPGNALATKRDRGGRGRMDWSLGPGVSVLREATGADYALFTYMRDSYATGGRTALRVFGFVVGAALGGIMDIGGGSQVGVATLVDLQTGQVVWYNLLANQSGDLRDAAGAQKTAQRMLRAMPVRAPSAIPAGPTPLTLPAEPTTPAEPAVPPAPTP